MEFLYGVISFKRARLGHGTSHQGDHHLRWMELDVLAANRLGVTDRVPEMVYDHIQRWRASRRRD